MYPYKLNLDTEFKADQTTGNILKIDPKSQRQSVEIKAC